MSARIAALIILLIILNSCQREDEITERLNNEALLIKIVNVTGTGTGPYDSTIITYDYDANKRLLKETTFLNLATSSGVQRLPFEREYTRDGNGRITRIRSTNRLSSNPLNVITSFSDVCYVDNNSTKVAYIEYDNNIVKTVFTYNSAGKIEKTETFQHYPLPTDPVKMTVYYRHQYDATGNLLTKTQFSDNDNNGVFEQAISYAFEYDTKLNPVDRSDDALFEWRWSWSSPANCVKQTNNYSAVNPPDGFTLVYQYRTDNKPEMATRAEFGGVLTGSATTTYYYQ
jgi:antitoxin component YwqK of YwqJK toxin-antitoxin module